MATATATVVTGGTDEVTSAGATLQGSFSGATGTIYDRGFYYGTSSSSLTQEVHLNSVSGKSGSFTATIGSLQSSTTYYYQAFVTEWDAAQSKYVDRLGSVRSFSTSAPGTVVSRWYLDCYEIPAISVSGYSSGNETHGNTQYHGYTTSNSNQMVVTHTFAYNGTKRNYSMLYDKSKKAALWVAFAMNTGSYPWLVSRSDSWKADPAIPEDWQPELSSAYQNGSTYSRGHQCASNDRRTTTDQTKQTTYFSNMTPQLSGFNGGVWATLEGDIQKIGNATSGNDTLYVVTGPIFGSGYGSTPDKSGNQCAVPTHYYKCIMKVTYNSSGEVTGATGAAFLFDHKSNAPQQNKTIRELETLTTFDFFANIPSTFQESAETTFTNML